MSEEKTEKKGKAPQMKIIIGMVQNSYRLINDLMAKIDGLSSKIDKLCLSLSDLANPNFEDTKMGKTINTLANLLLTSTSYNLNETITAPPPQPTPIFIQPAPMATTPGQDQPQPVYQPAPAQQPQEPQRATAADPNEPSLLKPSKLFKKLNR